MTMMVPFFDSTRQYSLIRADIQAAINRVLDSGKYVFGNEGTAFEQAFSSYIGVKHGIGVNSGTDALKIALKALSVRAGEEVITVANTAVPTVSSMRELGALPVFADTDAYFTIDPKKIVEQITPRTKAILVVHLYGQPADMEAIMKIAREKGLYVIEDCAQSSGASFAGKKLGAWGDISCFSFYPTKNLGAYGDGGMILTDNEALATHCRKLRFYGMDKAYYAEEEGFNSRLDEVQAAVLNTKLPFLDTWNERRREIARFYNEHITNPLLELPTERQKGHHVFHLYVMKCAHREALKKYLSEKGIGFGVHYEFPIHVQKAYPFLNIPKGSLPKTEDDAQEVISLPIFPELTDTEITYVAEALNRFSL